MANTMNYTTELDNANSQIKITPQDVIRFNKARVRKARANLNNAKNHRDMKAAANIQRKIALYKYTIELAEFYLDQTNEIEKKIYETD